MNVDEMRRERNCNKNILSIKLTKMLSKMPAIQKIQREKAIDRHVLRLKSARSHRRRIKGDDERIQRE